MRLLSEPAEGALAVTVTSLEMHDPGKLTVVEVPNGASWSRVMTDRHATSRTFYRTVGEAWHWVDRRDWTADQWRTWADRPEHHLLVCQRDGVDSGYAEVEEQSGGDMEIAYFGLLPEAIGTGLGRWWLAEVIRYAWSIPGARRIWVHTCTLDAPAALTTYQGCGLRECAREVEWRMPDPVPVPETETDPITAPRLTP